MTKKAEPKNKATQSDLDFLGSSNVLSHAGEWVAIANRRVIAHGPSLAEVHRKAYERAGSAKPTFYAVPEAAALY